MELPFQHNDGGMRSAGFSERNDCTVRAIATVAQVDYAEAWIACRKFGRRPRRRFQKFNMAAFRIGVTLGVKLEHVAQGCRLKELLQRHPKGRLLVQVPGHAFAVVDGVVCDTWKQGPNRRVYHAWLLVGRYEAPVRTLGRRDPPHGRREAVTCERKEQNSSYCCLYI